MPVPPESQPISKMTLDDWNAMIGVNLTGVFLTMQAGLSGMMDKGWGRIVSVASVAGLRGYPYVTAYCAAKHGVVGLTKAAALEVARTGITVNAVCPGYTQTPMLDRSIDNIMEKTGRSREEAMKPLLRQNPMGRFIEPEEVASNHPLAVRTAFRVDHRAGAVDHGRRSMSDATPDAADVIDRDKQRLRVWLRLLKIQRLMETEIRERLRVEFATTLPRFDVLAALYREEKGLKMSELSTALMVSNGNVTGIVERLVSDGLVIRVPVSGDRRAMLVRLTERGRAFFCRDGEHA